MVRKRALGEAGIGNVSLTAGDGTLAIVFKHAYHDSTKLAIFLSPMEDVSDTTLELWPSSIGVQGFTINVRSGSALSDVDIAWRVVETTL